MSYNFYLLYIVAGILGEHVARAFLPPSYRSTFSSKLAAVDPNLFFFNYGAETSLAAAAAEADPNTLVYKVYTIKIQIHCQDSNIKTVHVATHVQNSGLVAIQSSFLNTFSFRLVGGLAGNLLAAAVVTFVTANFKQAAKSFKEKQQPSTWEWPGLKKGQQPSSDDDSKSPVVYDGELYDKPKRRVISNEAWLKLVLCVFIGSINTWKYGFFLVTSHLLFPSIPYSPLLSSQT